MDIFLVVVLLRIGPEFDVCEFVLFDLSPLLLISNLRLQVFGYVVLLGFFLLVERLETHLLQGTLNEFLLFEIVRLGPIKNVFFYLLAEMCEMVEPHVISLE